MLKKSAQRGPDNNRNVVNLADYRKGHQLQVRAFNHLSETPKELYDIINKMTPLDIRAQRSFAEQFILSSEKYITHTGMFSLVLGGAALVGTIATAYHLWKHGLLGALPYGGITAMAGIICHHFYSQGERDRRQEILAYADSLSSNNKLDLDVRRTFSELKERLSAANRFDLLFLD